MKSLLCFLFGHKVMVYNWKWKGEPVIEEIHCERCFDRLNVDTSNLDKIIKMGNEEEND